MKNGFKILVVAILFRSQLQAQISPPLGPPMAPASASLPLVTLDFGTLTNFIRLGITRSVNNINQQIESTFSSTGVKARLSYIVKSVLPLYVNTESASFPNSNLVQLRIHVEYTVSGIRYNNIPYFSRKLFQRIVVGIACDKWYTGNGKSKIQFGAEKPYPDNASFPEQALNFFIVNTLTNYVDSKLTASLSGAGAAGTLPVYNNNSCNCLNFHRGTAPAYADGYVGVTYMPERILDAGAIIGKPVIELKSIKRIPVIGENQPATEDLQLEYMGNFSAKVVLINALQAGEVRNFEDVKLQIERPKPDNWLVIIGNITSITNPQQGVLSGFLAFKKDSNFGIGIQKLIVMKEVWMPAGVGPDGRPIKPGNMTVPFYEITFEVRNKSERTVQ